VGRELSQIDCNVVTSMGRRIGREMGESIFTVKIVQGDALVLLARPEKCKVLPYPITLYKEISGGVYADNRCFCLAARR
jgi:hypothetical protein